VYVFEFDPQIHASHLSPSQRIGTSADGDSSKPEEHVLRRIKSLKRTVKFQEDILRNLFGKSAISCHAKRDGEHHGLVPVHELFKFWLPIVAHISRCYSLIRSRGSFGMQRNTFLAGESSEV
jgi:hypothetical protein